MPANQKSYRIVEHDELRHNKQGYGNQTSA
jgi:hypothetical protein